MFTLVHAYDLWENTDFVKMCAQNSFQLGGNDQKIQRPLLNIWQCPPLRSVSCCHNLHRAGEWSN